MKIARIPETRDAVTNWKKRAVADVDENNNIIKTAEYLLGKGIKAKDALHVACAVELHCNYFITTDRKLIKNLSNFEQTEVMNPVDFINVLEGE